MEAREGNLGYQMDIYECIEVCDAETAMVDRQGNAQAEDEERSRFMRELHLLRTTCQIHEV